MAVDSADAAFEAGDARVDMLLNVMETAAASDHPAIAGAPLDSFGRYVSALTEAGSQARADARAFAAGLYRDRYEALQDAQDEQEPTLALRRTRSANLLAASLAFYVPVMMSSYRGKNNPKYRIFLKFMATSGCRSAGARHR